MKKLFTVLILSLVLVLIGTWGSLSTSAQNLSNAEKAELREQLSSLEDEIAEWQKVLDETKLKKNTLQGDVSILNAQIEQATKEIKQRTSKVALLNDEIKQKTATINSLEARINSDKILLANLLKKKDQNEVEPIFYLLMSSEDLSEMMTSVDNISTINKGLQDLFAELRDRQAVTEKAKNDLSVKKNLELDAQYEIEQKKKQISQNQTEKKQLLDFTAKAESNYQTVLADRQRKAEAIRSALFNLRDTQGISFSQALEYAKLAYQRTGVRPALILAILQQESDLGKNVGKCNVPGSSVDKMYTSIMPGPIHYANYLANGKSCTGAKSPCSWRDDQSIFVELTSRLGLDKNTTPLSCPIASVGGWGGAMGPSQFIPTTWKSYEPRLTKILGVKNPNPWNPEHAVTATALYMSELGASAGTYTAEKTAAAKYYAGNNYLSGAGQSYGNSVIAKAAKFQEDIDFLENL